MRVSDFEYIDDLVTIRYKNGFSDYAYVKEPYACFFKVDGKDIYFTVPAGTPTDGPSVPDLVPNWIIDRLDKHFEASVIHDYMCIIKGPWDNKVAAEVFYVAMQKAGVPQWQAWIMYQAVLKFGPQWQEPVQA